LLFIVALSVCDGVYHVAVSRGYRVRVIVDREQSTATVAKPNPVETQIDHYVLERYRKCWIDAYISTKRIPYMPSVEFRLARDGSLDGPPKLLNPSSDSDKRIPGEQALQAVERCGPISMPESFADYYDHWRTVDLYFTGELPIENRPRQ
jgi:hypothetical protein